jgi:hypothetical protein
MSVIVIENHNAFDSEFERQSLGREVSVGSFDDIVHTTGAWNSRCD